MGRPGLIQHRKFRRLARAVGGEALALGSLELMWSAAYEAGDDYLGDAADVEAAARWQGTQGVLLAALLDAGGPGAAGFVEEVTDRPGCYQIHDLHDHAPDYVTGRRVAETERRKEKRCAQCDGSFHSRDARARYCSSACRTAAWRMRNGDEHETDERQSVTSRDGPPAPAPAPVSEKDISLSHARNGARTEATPPTPTPTPTPAPPTPPEWRPSTFADLWTRHTRKPVSGNGEVIRQAADRIADYCRAQSPPLDPCEYAPRLFAAWPQVVAHYEAAAKVGAIAYAAPRVTVEAFTGYGNSADYLPVCIDWLAGKKPVFAKPANGKGRQPEPDRPRPPPAAENPLQREMVEHMHRMAAAKKRAEEDAGGGL